MFLLSAADNLGVLSLHNTGLCFYLKKDYLKHFVSKHLGILD